MKRFPSDVALTFVNLWKSCCYVKHVQNIYAMKNLINYTQ